MVRWDLLGASFVTSCSPPPSPPCRSARSSHGSTRLCLCLRSTHRVESRRSTRHRLPSQRALASRQAAASIIYDVLEVSIVGHYTLDIHSVRTDVYCVIICTLCCTLRTVYSNLRALYLPNSVRCVLRLRGVRVHIRFELVGTRMSNPSPRVFIFTSSWPSIVM